MTFTDISTGSPTAWNWSFGDETANSTQKNPLHIYSAAGNYTVSLTVTNAASSNTTTKSAYIKVKEPTPIPVANFSTNITSGNAVLNVAFTDTSTGSPNAWNRSFGDGTINSTVRNPVHIFNKAGNFTVSLTVKNEAGSNSVTKPNYIVVNALKPLSAAFSASPTSGKAPLTVTFTDKSTGSPTSWSWNFGDKSTSSARNPVHKYNKAGKYTIALKVKNAAGSNSATKPGYIIVK